MHSDFLLFQFLLGFLLPSFLLHLHAPAQSGIIKSVCFVAILLSPLAVVDVMVFVESLLFWVSVGVQLTCRVEDSSGLKIRLPAV